MASFAVLVVAGLLRHAPSRSLVPRRAPPRCRPLGSTAGGWQGHPGSRQFLDTPPLAPPVATSHFRGSSGLISRRKFLDDPAPPAAPPAGFSLSRLADDGRPLLKSPQRYSSKQWRTNLLSLPADSVLRAVGTQLTWHCLWALLVSLLYIRVRGVPSLPALPHSLLGGVLGVLLGFRTNQSYDRFWEGRKLWGSCVNSVRCIARSSLAHIDSDGETYAAVMRYLRAYPIALKQHLRGEVDIEAFRGTLDGRELSELSSADNLPLSVCISLSMSINAIKLDTAQSANALLWWTLEDHVSKLSAIVSDCERIVRTPVPMACACAAHRTAAASRRPRAAACPPVRG